MTQSEQENPDHQLAIRNAVRMMLTQRGWRLLAEEDMAHQVDTLLRNGASDDVRWAIFHVYSQALHSACAGNDGSEAQRIGYAELFRYLYDMSVRFAKDLSVAERKELADQTLADLFYRLIEPYDQQRRAGVRNPGAFLAVAMQLLRNAIRKWRRDILAYWDEAIERQEASAAIGPEHRAIDRDFRRRVRQCFVDSLQRHPRARMQLWVVWLRHIDGLDYPAISVELKMTIPNLRVLHARGLDRLREDSQWRELGYESGLIEGSVSLHNALPQL